MRLTPRERVAASGEFSFSRLNSEFEPFCFGHHVDGAPMNSLERSTTTLQNSTRLDNFQALVNREVFQILIGYSFQSGFEALALARDKGVHFFSENYGAPRGLL